MSLSLKRVQTLSLDQFHRKKQVAIFLAVSQQPDNVRVIELQERIDFRFEPGTKMVVIRISGRKDLDRNFFVTVLVGCTEYGPHSASTKDFLDLIRTEAFDRHG